MLCAECSTPSLWCHGPACVRSTLGGAPNALPDVLAVQRAHLEAWLPCAEARASSALKHRPFMPQLLGQPVSGSVLAADKAGYRVQMRKMIR